MGKKEIFKKDLVNRYSEDADITKTEALQRIDDVLDLIKDALFEGHDVKLSGFFNFFVRERRAKEGVNPITQAPMTIPASKYVHVKMSKTVKDRIQGK